MCKLFVLTVAVAMAAHVVVSSPEEDLTRLALADVAKPVRPVGVNGQTEAWNENATWFMYPPTFKFAETPGARLYYVRAIGADGKTHAFEQKTPVVSLESVWTNLPTGRTELWCDACLWSNTMTMRRHFKSFWKMEPYRPGTYPKAPRGYAEAAVMGGRYLLNCKWLRTYAETGRPDMEYKNNCYPTKMDAAVISLMTDFAGFSSEDSKRAITLARTIADRLISSSQPADAPLAHFPPTYFGDARVAARSNAGVNVLVHPAEAGSAYLKLWGVTKEQKYLEAARRIAETYLRLQGEDGTWYFKMREADGEPTNENRLHPWAVIDFLDTLFGVTADMRYRAAAERAFDFFERGPLRDWNWEGQFEDMTPTGKYINLTKHPACWTACHLLKRWPSDPGRIAQARELLRFAEDQFVVWKRPESQEDGMRLGLLGSGWKVEPAVVEQYHFREAVDASASRLITTYLALYKATGNPLDLAKARTLGDSIVRIQETSGRIPTCWSGDCTDIQGDWLNCMVSSVRALIQLSGQK